MDRIARVRVERIGRSSRHRAGRCDARLTAIAVNWEATRSCRQPARRSMRQTVNVGLKPSRASHPRSGCHCCGRPNEEQDANEFAVRLDSDGLGTAPGEHVQMSVGRPCHRLHRALVGAARDVLKKPPTKILPSDAGQAKACCRGWLTNRYPVTPERASWGRVCPRCLETRPKNLAIRRPQWKYAAAESAIKASSNVPSGSPGPMIALSPTPKKRPPIRILPAPAREE